MFAGLQRRTSQAAETSRPDRLRNVVGFADGGLSEQTIGGRGEVLRTTALDLCTGLAVTGIYRQADGTPMETSVTLFHVMPNASEPEATVEAHIQQLLEQGFQVDAFVAGGDDKIRVSREVRSSIEGMLTSMNVPFEQGPSDGVSSQYLTARIENDGEVTYRSSRGRI